MLHFFYNFQLKKAAKFFFVLLICVSVVTDIFCSQSAFADTFREALNRGRNLEAEGNDEGAISAYMMAKNIAPSPINDGSLLLARIYVKLARYAEAENEYQLMISASRDKTFRYEYGAVLVHQGKFRQATSIWSELLAEDPKDTKAMYYMGLCLEGTDNIDSAKDYYQQVISNDKGEKYESEGKYAASAQEKLDRLNNAITQRASAKFFPIDADGDGKGFGWWDLKQMPLRVYIDDGTGVTGFRSSLIKLVYNSLDAWRQASSGHFNFRVEAPNPPLEAQWKKIAAKTDPRILAKKYVDGFPPDPVPCDIHVHWVDNLTGILGLALPDTIVKVEGENTSYDQIKHCHIWLVCNSFADQEPLPTQITTANVNLFEKHERMVQEVATHEIGHALGLPHSPNPKDILCSGIYSLNSYDLVESRNLSPGDIASLAEHYHNYSNMNMFAHENAKDSFSENSGTRSLIALSNNGGSSLLSRKNNANLRFSLLSPKGTNLQTNSRNNVQNNSILPSKNVSILSSASADINSGHAAEALVKLNQILSKDPNNLSGLYLRAVAYVMLRDYVKAESDYKSVLRLAPGSAFALKASKGLEKLGNKLTLSK